jgi:ABC-type antimicrobial peptide transport system permease subunit
MLFNVAPTDTLTYLVVIILLSSAAMAATLIPARRATRIDPMRALRTE